MAASYDFQSSGPKTTLEGGEQVTHIVLKGGVKYDETLV